MALRFQAAALVASPSYPNSIAWSDENLIAVASGHIVTILNPDMPYGPRGVITIPPRKPFPVGVIERKDLLSGCLLPTCLSRDPRPCARSVSWSPIGLAPNAGCLLAVCTTDGWVKLYRFPFCEFSSEWVEVIDLSELLLTYLAESNFGEHDSPFDVADGQDVQQDPGNELDEDQPISVLIKGLKRKRKSGPPVIEKIGCPGTRSLSSRNSAIQTITTEVTLFPFSALQVGSFVEILTHDGTQRTWVAGVLDQLQSEKARIIFPEANGNVKSEKWVEINPKRDENSFPILRPSMKLGTFPVQLLSVNCRGMEDILKVGQSVEAWTNDRWFEGVYMGLAGSRLKVKRCGEKRAITLDTSSVRLAPIWNNEKKAWQVTAVQIKREKHIFDKAVETNSNRLKKNNTEAVGMPNSGAKAQKKVPEKTGLSVISADQYAARSAMLSSLVVAWSPMVRVPSEVGKLSTCFSLLAVGAKDGTVSFWKMNEPECYSVVQGGDSTTAYVTGILRAHKTWVTAITWGLLTPDDESSSQLLLATGCSDGSVKLWRVYISQLLKSSQERHDSFSLLKEIGGMDFVPVSALSLVVAVESQKKIVLAVGKGSGALEVWKCDISIDKFDKFGPLYGHDQIVTGLSWAYDGKCLYSCSQDNFLRSWKVDGTSLFEVLLPPNILGARSSMDVPDVFESCFGLAISPSSVAVAVVRSFDTACLNPMYQARAQKAAVEFFWIGGQKLESSSSSAPDFGVEAFPDFPDMELVPWAHNILCSLNHYEHPGKPLVVWDILAALLAFKQITPKFVEQIVTKWLKSHLGSSSGFSSTSLLPCIVSGLSNLTSRQLHLLNIINRRVILANVMTGSNRKQRLGPSVLDEQTALWIEILEMSEKELRERLIGFSFSAVITSNPSTEWLKPGYWQPVGLIQMRQWVANKDNNVKDNIKFLAEEVEKLSAKVHSMRKDTLEEQCSYCCAPVHFEDAEIAFCRGVKRGKEVAQKHRLARCAVSLQVCPTSPTWYCSCCQRRVSHMAPNSFFTMRRHPMDSNSTFPCGREVVSKPLCPLCGILLQRLQPQFLLSSSPV